MSTSLSHVREGSTSHHPLQTPDFVIYSTATLTADQNHLHHPTPTSPALHKTLFNSSITANLAPQQCTSNLPNTKPVRTTLTNSLHPFHPNRLYACSIASPTQRTIRHNGNAHVRQLTALSCRRISIRAIKLANVRTPALHMTLPLACRPTINTRLHPYTCMYVCSTQASSVRSYQSHFHSSRATAIPTSPMQHGYKLQPPDYRMRLGYCNLPDRGVCAVGNGPLFLC